MKPLIGLCFVAFALVFLAACGSSEDGMSNPTPSGTPAYVSKLSATQAKDLAKQYVEVQAKAVTCPDGKDIMDKLSQLLEFAKRPQPPSSGDHNWRLGTNIGDFIISDDSFAVSPSGDAQEMIAMWLELANAWCARVGQ